MTTVTIPKKEYTELKKKQAQMAEEIVFLRKIFGWLAEDELDPKYRKELERKSKALDAGKGRQFRTLKEFRSYVGAL